MLFYLLKSDHTEINHTDYRKLIEKLKREDY